MRIDRTALPALRRAGRTLAASVAAMTVAVTLCAPGQTGAQAPLGSPQPPDPTVAQGDTGAGSPPPPLVTRAEPRVEASAEAAALVQSSGLECEDFKASPGGSWTAVASVRFPGPQGEIRIPAGQTLEPGAYVSGLDLAAILQARCH